MVESAQMDHQKDLQGSDVSKLMKSEDEWRRELSPQLYRMLRERGTEMPHSHEYDQFYPDKGHFTCAGCDLPLYSAASKFQSSCGWPVFNKCYHSKEWGTHVGTRSDGSGSLEIYCPNCGGHLGHVFFDSHSEENPNGERH
jgi:peptide-methionine (R)-S-oxide reductase